MLSWPVFSSTNSIEAGRMSAAERLAEIAEILALGLVRLKLRKSSELFRDSGESSLHFTPAKSSHATRTEKAGRR
jgi:hypothetical protein